ILRELRRKIDFGGADIMGEGGPCLVGLQLAYESGVAAKARRADDGIGGRPSGYDGYRTHGLIESLGARLVDQHHAALVQALGGEKIIIGPADNVDNGVTKTKHIEPVR